MSVRCINAVFERSGHTGTELLMLLALADHSDDHGNSYPSVATLARKCRMKSRNANYILAALQASGELCVVKNGAPRGTNLYRIMLASLGGNPLQGSAPLQAGASLQAVAPLHPVAAMQSGAATSAKGCMKPLQSLADEPSLNRQEPSKQDRSSSTTRPAAKTRAACLEGFDAFWGLYPNRKAKQDALKAWAKLKPDPQLQALILQAVREQSQGADWRKEAGRFVPHAATWLNGGRWMDEPAGVTASHQQLDLQGVL